MASLTVDLFTDVCCPWCFIGTRRLEQALADTGASANVTIVHRPFLLFPETPPEGIDIAATVEYAIGCLSRSRANPVSRAAASAGANACRASATPYL